MRGKPLGRFTPARPNPPEDDGGDRWLTTYADAITLLMAFFVMLYAMSEVDVQKFQAFVAGLADPFNNHAASEALLPAGTSIVGDAGLSTTDAGELVPPEDPISLEAIVPQDRLDKGGEVTQDVAQLREVEDALLDALGDQGLEAVASYRYDERGLVVSIASDDVLFDTGSTHIDVLGRDIVATLASVLASFPNDIIIEGHTDDVPLNRGGYTNWNLSTDRAVAVLELLIEEHGFDQERLGAAGYGEYRPIAPNDTASNRARNRRVDVLVVAEGVNDG